MKRSVPLQSDWQPLLEDQPMVVGEGCACDPAFPCAADAAEAQEHGLKFGTDVADPATLQLKGLMAGLGLIARPVL